MHEIQQNSTATIMFHQAIATKLGLNPTDHKCLDVIVKNQPITAGQLSELTGLTTGAVTGVLDRLEKVGYVIRVKDPQDKRRVIIQANEEKAEKEIVPVFNTVVDITNEMLAGYSDEELELIYKFFIDCNQRLVDMRIRLRS